MQCPQNPNWYITQRRQLDAALEAQMASYELKVGPKSATRLNAVKDAGLAATIALAGGLAIGIGAATPALFAGGMGLIVSKWKESAHNGKDATYHAARRVSTLIDDQIAQLPPPARYHLAARQFEALSKQLQVMSGLIDVIYKAAAAA